LRDKNGEYKKNITKKSVYIFLTFFWYDCHQVEGDKNEMNKTIGKEQQQKPILYVTKIFEFHAAHFLKSHNGKCAQLHGHTYKLEVTCAGHMNENGIVIDFGDVEHYVNMFIIEVLDHTCLNNIKQFEDNPTAEKLAYFIYNTLNEIDIPLKVTEVKVWETPTSYATYKGELM